MTGPISRNRLLGSLKEAASWPGADRNTVVTLAIALVAARADAEGSRYFQDMSERNPGDTTAQALAGFFAVRAGHDVAPAITKLDKAATMDLGLPQYFRGLALAELLPGAGPSEAGHAADLDRAGDVSLLPGPTEIPFAIGGWARTSWESATSATNRNGSAATSTRCRGGD